MLVESPEHLPIRQAFENIAFLAFASFLALNLASPLKIPI